MKPRCAVIDDDPDWIDLIVHCLDRAGARFETVPFFEATAALDYLRQNHVDLVVSDLQMPKMDGLAFVQELRLFDQSTPVVLVSSDPSVAGEAVAAGATAFVRKGALRTDLPRTAGELVAIEKDAPSR